MSNSNYFAGIEIKSDETFVEALCRVIPERQRVMTGLSLKLILLRMKKLRGEDVGEQEIEVINKFNRLNKMTNEEYEELNEN